MIEPRVLKGFRDTLPNEELRRREFMGRIEQMLRRFGYVPIDTPTLEYKEVLVGKSGEETERQIFQFVDNGGREVGLRFDLTVPLARFVAANEKDLVFPFKRYHIAKAWRGEKPQRGRYREFYQADFDIIGSNSLGSDVETLLLVNDLVTHLGVKDFSIHVSDRSLLREIFAKENLLEREGEILACLDKTYKVGANRVRQQLVEMVGELVATRLDFLLTAVERPSLEFFAHLRQNYGLDGCRLEKILGVFAECGLAGKLVLDTTITRGLDYYTGMVFETFINDAVSLGSIASGGRYANLTGLFSANVHEGIGGSIGLDRLLAHLQDQGKTDQAKQVDVVIFNFQETDLAHYLKVARQLRDHGLSVEVYPESARLKKQLTYATRKNARLGIFLGESEIAEGKIKAKQLEVHEEREFASVSDLIEVWG